MGIFRRDEPQQLEEPETHVRILHTEEEIEKAKEQMESTGPSDELRERWAKERGLPDLPPDTRTRRQS